jgi:hypothetical protein
LALLKIAVCSAPVLSSDSACRRFLRLFPPMAVRRSTNEVLPALILDSGWVRDRSWSFPATSFDCSLLIEQEVRDDLSETLVLIPQRANFPSIASVHFVVLVAPAIECRFSDPQLPAHVHGGRSGFDLSKRPDLLLLREPARAHGRCSECWGSCLTLAHIIRRLYHSKG